MTTRHDMTAEEFFESLTGFDEIAVARAFGEKPIRLSDTDAMAFARCLVFVARRREGMSDADAKNAALSATVREVNEFFAEDEEPNPEEPVTESGKGGPDPVSEPRS